jgi:RNA polymerase sigma-70 factor (ECF subfamily)
MFQDQRPLYDCERLYRYFEEVYEQLLQIGRTRHLDEWVQKDLIHELFLSFYEKQIDFDTISYPNSYIITSYKRKIIDFFRESHRDFQDDSWMNHPLTLIPSAETTLIEKESMQEAAQLLRKAYDQLPERCKRAIFLKYYKGLSVSAIQAETGWSAQSIYNYLSIGIKQLKAELVVHPNLANGGASMLLLLLFATI